MNEPSKFEFAKIVFFGRSIDEYVLMFNLELEELAGLKLLDCNAGPAAFAKQAEAKGITVTACDPMYEHSPEELRKIVDRDAQIVIEKQMRHRDELHPELTPTSVRREAMEVFLQDYEKMKGTERYVPALLPVLPFPDESFDMALSANFLFLYSNQGTGGMMEDSPFDLDFHRKSIAELLRVCKREVRFYPLQGPHEMGHQFLGPIMQDLASQGLTVELQAVRHRDIIGAEQLLRVSKEDS